MAVPIEAGMYSTIGGTYSMEMLSCQYFLRNITQKKNDENDMSNK